MKLQKDEFVDNVLALMECEHGAETGAFDDLKKYVAAAYETEGGIHDLPGYLEELCCGEETEHRRGLEAMFPKLTRIFESVFDGEEPFPL